MSLQTEAVVAGAARRGPRLIPPKSLFLGLVRSRPDGARRTGRVSSLAPASWVRNPVAAAFTASEAKLRCLVGWRFNPVLLGLSLAWCGSISNPASSSSPVATRTLSTDC